LYRGVNRVNPGHVRHSFATEMTAHKGPKWNNEQKKREKREQINGLQKQQMKNVLPVLKIQHL